MFQINYLKRGTKEVPDEWAFGKVVSTKKEACDYECVERGFATEKDAKARVEVLKKITIREYHSFTISEYELTPIVGYSIIGFSCNMFHTKEDAIKYIKRHKKDMPNGIIRADGTIDEWYILERREDDVKNDIMHPVYLDECPKGKKLTPEQEKI